MFTAAAVLANIEGQLPDAVRYSVRFAKPVVLPARAGLYVDRTSDGWELALRHLTQGLPAPDRNGDRTLIGRKRLARFFASREAGVETLIDWAAQYSAPILVLLCIAAATIFVLKMVTERTIEAKFSQMQKTIELSLERRSEFEQRVLLDRYQTHR